MVIVFGGSASVAIAGAVGNNNPVAAQKSDAISAQLSRVASLPKRPKPNPADAQARAAALEPSDADVRTAGIRDDMHQGPFPAVTFRVSNFYQGPVGTSWYLVYAGSTADGLGAIRIFSETPQHQMTMIGTYPRDGLLGAVRVSTVAGTVLTLSASNGSTLYFDLGSLRYQ